MSVLPGVQVDIQIVANSSVDFRFGGEHNEALVISVSGRAYHHSKDYWDGNWLLVHANVQARHFTATVPGLLRAEELSDFSAKLSKFQQEPVEPVEFSTVERWLSLFVETDKLGHVRVSGSVSDNFGLPNRLEFVLVSEQAALPAAVRQIEQVVKAYPIIGTKP
jgi:hypothetical protein